MCFSRMQIADGSTRGIDLIITEQVDLNTHNFSSESELGVSIEGENVLVYGCCFYYNY